MPDIISWGCERETAQGLGSKFNVQEKFGFERLERLTLNFELRGRLKA
jgi:hypothetical protein